MAEFKLGRLRFVWQGEWTTGTAYVKDDIVRYGGSSYVCVGAHTAASDFYTNFDSGKWELMTSGLQWSTTPWTQDTFYPEGSIVRYGGKIYVSVDGHTASADFNTDFDAGDWQLFVDGIQWKTDQWTTVTLYKEGDLVRHGGRVYIAIDGHTSTASFKTDYNSAKWQLFTDGVQWKTSPWTASTLYKVGDVVRVSGKTYICVDEHTASATQRGGFYPDLQIGKWNLYTDGSQYRGSWDTAEYYWLGDIVRYGAKSFVCVLGHEADSDFNLDVDADKWELFNDGFQWLSDWTNGTYYKEGDVVKHGGTTYLCVNGHMADSSAVEGFDRDLDLNFWQEYSAGFDWKDQWITGTYYKLNDIVRYGAKAYVCVSGHVGAADFNLDVDAASWELLVDGQQWKTTPWSIGTLYKEGDLVRHGGRVYICTNGHTSTAFSNRFDIDFDNGEWQLFSDGTQWKSDPWTAGEYYKIGDIVKYGGKTYVAIDDHEADAEQAGGFYTDLAANNWDLYADGTEWRGDWIIQTYYKIGDIVRYDGNVYICQIPHLSAATIQAGLEQDLDLDSTQAKWDVFSEGFKYKGTWTTDTKYNVNDVVKFGGSLYICTGYHSSDVSSFQEQYWNILLGGLEFEDTWNPSLEYQIGDIVTYGGYSYVAQTRNTGKIPPGFDADWNLLTTGFKVTGEWSDTRSYKVGELVKYGGSSYVAIVETGPGQKPTAADGSTSILWEVVAPGIKWRGEWTGETQYRIGDAVKWVANSYICKIDHTSVESGSNQPDNDTNGIYWDSLAEGAEGNKLARRGDLLTRDATQNKRLARGVEGQVLQVRGRDVVWDYFNVVDNVYYVDINGVDAPTRGTSLQTAFRTIKYASEYILADEANRSPATIFVKTGTFREELPIIIPANVAVVGDELRSTRIEPAFNYGITGVTIVSPGAGYSTAPTVTFQTPQQVGGVVAEGYATIAAGQLTGIVITKAGSGYTSAPIVTFAGGTPSSAASVVARLKEKPYNQTDMFYMRDGSGLRNCTTAALDISLGAPNQYLTQRPVSDCAYVSLDPGTGPGDEAAWIVNRSPYVQNVTTFGNGAVGMKVDGSLHNGGAKTIVCNDFTQVISDGIGIWCTNQGRSECVSVFTYYAHLGYLSENGGVIRGTNGNCSYGTFGVSAEGVDPSEVSRIAQVNNRKEEAQIINTFVDGDGIVVLEYSNAGENYQPGNTTYEFGGSGVANSIVVSAVNVRDGGVNEVRVLDAGEGWLSVTNNAQNGTDVSIRLSASDVQATNAYVGERLVIIDGQGVGQYGYIVSFNGGTKETIVAKESFTPLVVTATSSVNNRLTVSDTSTLSVNQAIVFENSSALIGGLTENTTYYVRAVPTSTQFTISETVGGSELNLTTETGLMNLHSAGFESLYEQAIEATLDTTTRYTIEPRVVFSTGIGATASGTISKGVDVIGVTQSGAYYQAAPTVVITGPELNSGGATATASIIGTVADVRIRAGGSGFVTAPSVQFVGGGLANGSSDHAVGIANITGKITSVSVTAGGSGYDENNPPEVVISGDGYNNDAYISATVTNIVGDIFISSGGANYTVVPAVTITGGGGSGAEAIANLSAVVTGFTLLEGGSGYTAITTSISVVPSSGDNTGDGATAEVVIDNGTIGGPGVITGITLLTAGTNYTKPPIVIITSSGLGTGAEATADINGTIASVTVTQGGSGYTSAPSVAFSSGTATAFSEITGAVSELKIISGGTGFTDTASILIVSNSPAAGATAIATVSSVVESVTITSGGTGYTSPPTVAISGGGGVGALASSFLNASVQTVTVNTPGSNYVTTPTVAFVGAHNFKSIVAGESYYRNSSALVAISDVQLTETLAAMEYVKVLANAIATNTDPTVEYQSVISRTGTATAPADAYAQTAFWVDVIKTIAYNGITVNAANIIASNKTFIAAEAVAWATANDSAGISYTESDLRKRVRLLVDAIVYDLTAGTTERTVAIGQQYGFFVTGEISFANELLTFVNELAQDIISNTVVVPLNGESAVQVFAELVTIELKAPNAVANLINLIKSMNNLSSILGNTANSTYTNLLLSNKVWIQAEVIEYVKRTYPNFVYDQTLCGRDVGLIVEALAQDVRYAQTAIPVANATTSNVLSNITVITGGEGYGEGTTVSFTGDLGTGSAPIATVVRNLAGAVTGFTITQPGKGFTVAPSVTINADTGSGAYARAFVLGGLVQDIRIIHPGSGYSAPPYVKLVDPNNINEARLQVRIGDGVLDQPTFSFRGTGYLAARSFVESPTGFADIYQTGEFIYVQNLTNIPTPGANIQFGENPIFYKLVTIRDLLGDTGLIGGRNLIIANRAYVQRQIISYINTTYPSLVYNQDLCRRDVGLIIDAISADVFGDTERGIEAGKSYFRNASGVASITGNQLTATLAALDKIEEYLVSVVQNIDIPRNQLFELQVKEPSITGGIDVVAPLQNTLDIIRDTIQNGNTIYTAQDILLDNKPFIEAEVLAFVNTTYPDFVYTQNIGQIIDALAYDLFAGLGTHGTAPFSGLTRSREAGVRYLSDVTLATQLAENIAAIAHIGVVVNAVLRNANPDIIYQTAISRILGGSLSIPLYLRTRAQSGVDEIINIVTNGLSVLPLGTYSARLQVSPPFNVDNVPNHNDDITIRSKYSQVRISAHDFLNVGTGNKAATNYPGLPVNAPEPENEVLEAGGGRCFYTSTDQDGNFRVGELFAVEQATGIATLNADAFNLSGLNELSLGGINIGGTGATITEFSTDSTFFANSDSIVPTQKAVKTFIASQLGSGGGNLSVNAITAGDIQVSGNEISTNDDGGLLVTSPNGFIITEAISSTSTTTGSIVVEGGVGIAENVNIGGDLTVGDDVNVTGDLVVTGNLTVNGDTTTLSVGTLNVEDANVTIAKGAANAAAANGAGITVEGPTTPATFLYASADDSWNFNKIVKATSIQATPIGSSTASSGAFTTLTANAAVTVTVTTSSDNSATGALVVGGGLGVGGNINTAGTMTSVGLTATGTVSLSPANTDVSLTPSGTGTVSIRPGSAVGTIDNMNIGGNVAATGRFTTVTTTSGTASTSTSTGDLIVTGGAGIGGAIYAGSIQNTPIGNTTANSGAFTTITASGTADFNGAVTIDGANVSATISPTGTGTVTIAPATTGTINNMSIGATTRSTAAFTTLTTNGAVTVTGGTTSSSSTTGQLVVTGGVGVSENLSVGGQLTVTGNLVVNGTTSTINSTELSVDDINITLGDTASPSDITADGGGITLRGATNKTITWVNSTGRWTFNQAVAASSIQGTPIGSTAASTGAFTSLTANAAVTFTQGTASSSTSTGTVVVTGGVGVSGRVSATDLTVTNAISGSITGNAATVTNGVYTTGDQTIAGVKTFSSTIVGSINGNSATVTNGVYTTGNQNIGGIKTFNNNTTSTSTGTGSVVVTGGVGISENLNVGGTFKAVSKSFLIDHPTKEGMKLQYGSLEGPEYGVYVRGKISGSNVIELPDYWTGLVDDASITVNLTAIGSAQGLYIEKIEGNRVYVGGGDNFFYTVYGERKDVAKLVVEYKA